MPSLCQVHADTNLELEKFYFSSFFPSAQMPAVSMFPEKSGSILFHFNSTPPEWQGQSCCGFFMPAV